MKKTIIVITAILMALPLSLMAQGGPVCDGTGPGPGGGQGMGMRACMPGQGGPGMPGGGPGRMGGRHDGAGIARLLAVADEIGLTDQQKTDLKKMVETFQLDRIDREAALDKAEVKLRGLMMDDKAVESQVLAQIDQVSKLKAEIQKMRYQHRTQVQSILTDDQKAKLQELRKTRMQNRFDDDDAAPGRGMGRRMGRG